MDRGKQGGVERDMNFSLGKIIGRETRDGRRELSPFLVCLSEKEAFALINGVGRRQWGEVARVWSVLVKVSAVEQQAQ